MTNEIRTARRAADLTQSAVAKRAGLSQATLSNIEKGIATPLPERRERVLRAIDELVSARAKLAAVREALGL